MNGGSMQMVILVAMIGVFYLFFIRPQQKKQKEQKKFRDNLQAGDRVVTIGGVHGKVLEVTDTTVLINSDGTKIRFSKNAIQQSTEEMLG